MHIENGLRSKKILLVDDSLLTSKMVSEFLNANGYETETVAAGEEAVQKACSMPIDLILMDIELAGEMNGIEAARRIIKYRDIPVIFFTGNTSQDIIDKMKEVRAYGFVIKGMDKALLLSTVEMTLNLHEANTQTILFNRIFENFVNEIYIFDAETLKFSAVNRAAVKNIGYTREELHTMTLLDIKPEFDRDCFQKVLNRLSSGEQQQIFHNAVYRRKNGSLYPVEMNLQLLNYGGKKLFLALAVDLTERSAMKDQLTKKESMLDAIINSAQDAIVILNSQGNVTLWNHAAEQIFGYTREEILGKNLHRLVGMDEHTFQNSFEFFRLAGAKNAKGKTIEVKAKHKNGHELNIEVSMSFLKIMDDLHCIAIIHDISERKRAQEELINSRKQYFELAENAPIGIILCDEECNILYVNPKTLEILGSPGIEETKKINLRTFPLLVQYGLSNRLDECMQNNELGIFEMNYESKWGKKVFLRLHVKPRSDKGKVTGAQVIIDDITEKKQMEEELRSLSLTDYLTNVYNRRFFIRKLEEEIELIRRRNRGTFSLTMLDVDHFKRINDRYGHNVGDQVLKNLTYVIKNRIRKADCLARWGGEEFVILMQGTTVNNAMALVEELRESISKMILTGVDSVTASFGVVEYNAGDTVDSLIQKADNLMYEAKAAGRNCVRC
ncbi:PAS domain S-box protein [Caproiciproducens galactitolivorans]|uniref:Stage 0 sporulation protein A homolog n=1 Tax=Caproiciproducens galactitolivorans TaxID=642589 RepID=A0ABT4BRP6_9FIRM|nr:PAS domain S-box protein [Caproiciproducens galactitolivorans]MCY1713566.1 PAS domain S-box protein [Caproiciproducens galactitolivorans]